MVQWLSNAGIVRASTVTTHLWQAEQDESTIPRTNPYLLAFVLSKGVNSSGSTIQAIGDARKLHDCMGEKLIERAGN